jgi:hypothetical protein
MGILPNQYAEVAGQKSFALAVFKQRDARTCAWRRDFGMRGIYLFVLA